MILEGYVTDKDKAPIAKAVVEVKGEDFVTRHYGESDETGYYKLDLPGGRYPFLTAVKDYGVNCLEYWCQDLVLRNDMVLNMRFDKLEIYGLHVFPVKGAANGLMAYFRPMSLPKYRQGAEDIVPDDIAINVMIDGQEAPVITVNPVRESGEGWVMSAYLIQVATAPKKPVWHRFDIEITDRDGHYGAATIFNPEA